MQTNQNRMKQLQQGQIVDLKQQMALQKTWKQLLAQKLKEKGSSWLQSANTFRKNQQNKVTSYAAKQYQDQKQRLASALQDKITLTLGKDLDKIQKIRQKQLEHHIIALQNGITENIQKGGKFSKKFTERLNGMPLMISANRFPSVKQVASIARKDLIQNQKMIDQVLS